MSKNIQRLKDVAAFVVSEAKRLGATDCSVVLNSVTSDDVGIRLGEVEELEGANAREMRVRCLVGKRGAVSITSDFTKRGVTKLVRETIAMAKASEEDPFAGLPEAGQFATTGDVDLNLFDPTIAKLPIDRKIELAKRAEATGRGFDPRITNTEGGSFSTKHGITVLANSRGFVGGYEGSSCSIGAAMVASQDQEMQVGYWGHGSRHFANVETPESIGEEAARRALRNLGSVSIEKVKTVPVVFDPQMAAGLLRQFISCAEGAHVYRQSSCLWNKLGKEVAAPGLVIVDDGMIPGAVGSRPFDGEGLPTNRRVLVSDGKLQAHLLDSYTCRRLANGWTPNGGEITNLFIQAGTATPEEIIASVKDGLYLTGVAGPGFNKVTGNYSRAATGIWIENGKLTHPVSQISIASNIVDMFKGIEAIGNDLDMRGAVSAPTLKIGKMSVAGSKK